MCKWIHLSLLVIVVWNLKAVYCTRCDFDLDVARRTIHFDSLGKDKFLCAYPFRPYCSCVIKALPGNHIRSKFVIFNLANNHDRLYVYDGNSTHLNTLLGSFTGTKQSFTVQSSGPLMTIQLKRDFRSRTIFKASYNYSTTKERPKIIVPSPVVRTVPGHFVWCSAEGFPPINMTLLRNSTSLANGIGRVMKKADKEDNYICFARNEAGTDSKEFPVTFVGCENACSGDGSVDKKDKVNNEFSCTNIGSTIDLFNCLPTTATELDLQLNEISSISLDAFADLKGLNTLDLSSNIIPYLPTGLFTKQTSLAELNLQNNRIQNLTADIFSPLLALQTLNVKDNQIQNLTAEIFSSLMALRVLDLSSNIIPYLPTGLFTKQTSLAELFLSHNKIEVLPEGIFENLSSLRYLYLSHNKIEALPEGIFQSSPELWSLYLQWNQLSNLTSGLFSNLRDLISLDVSHNKIEVLPKGIFQSLQWLEYLYLSHNKIEALPEGIFQSSPKLSSLDLSVNKIEALSGVIFQNLSSL
ncbi:uncharacterized protein LOC144640220 [Oculina patagonica]